MSSRIRWLAAAVVTLAVIAGITGVSRTFGPRGHFTYGADDDTTTPFNLVSMPALIEHRYNGSDLQLLQLQHQDRYANRWQIRYEGDGLTLGGTLSLPRTRGPHPVVLSLHGYVPPPWYSNGAGLRREEQNLVRRGYVVLHPDYRNFGTSEQVGHAAEAVRSPLGYPADALNALVALRRAQLSNVDLSRVAVLGRSMGGGVAMQVAAARPSWFRAVVLYSPVSSDVVRTYREWVGADTGLRRRVNRAYGSPLSNPAFWYEASVSHYLDRLRRLPVQIHHGLSDRVCPESWSAATAEAMRSAGVTATLDTYPGEPHRFGRSWWRFMLRVDSFLAARLG